MLILSEEGDRQVCMTPSFFRFESEYNVALNKWDSWYFIPGVKEKKNTAIFLIHHFLEECIAPQHI